MNEQRIPETLTVSDIRRILNIGSNSVYNLIHSKSFPVKRVGHTYRIPSKPFYRWLGIPHPELAEDLASKSHS